MSAGVSNIQVSLWASTSSSTTWEGNTTIPTNLRSILTCGTGSFVPGAGCSPGDCWLFV